MAGWGGVSCSSSHGFTTRMVLGGVGGGGLGG